MPAARTSPPRLARGCTIVFDGDSNTNRRTPPSLDTWPYLQLMNWQATWADEVARLLFCWRPELRLVFHNAAVGGSIAADLDDRAQRFVVPHRPKLVIATIGANDCARAIPLADFERSVRSYTASVAGAGGRVAWIVNNPDLDGLRKHLEPYRRVLKRVAAAERGWCIDVGPAMMRAIRELRAQWDGHTIFSDGSHLNAVGATVLAGEVLRFLGDRR